MSVTVEKDSAEEGVLVLEDGAVFRGRLVSGGRRIGEVVFNTSMTGYQEILTDPSYCGQIVVMTQPHIGNYGTFEQAEESHRPWVEGFVAREFTTTPSGVAGEPLPEYLRRHQIPAIEGLDTRAVVRRLREKGSLRGIITSADEDTDSLVEELLQAPLMEGRALVDDVTCREEYELPADGEEKTFLAVYDFGVKRNILRSLQEGGARVRVLPARTPADRCRELGVDGVVLSNGPGDPEPLSEIVEQVRLLCASGLPVLGICLGHQLLGLAMGGRTFKLKFGHHGGNQPVLDEDTGTVAITSQNHGFALAADSLPANCRVTATNLNDGTVEGFEIEGAPIYSVQYHPEAAPGPHDAARLFGYFLQAVLERSTRSAGAPIATAGSATAGVDADVANS